MTSRAELSRVTLVGERRRADIVLPSDTPIGHLLPDILRLLDDRVAARPLTRQLLTSDGSALPHDSTLASSGISDGAVLRLRRGPRPGSRCADFRGQKLQGPKNGNDQFDQLWVHEDGRVVVIEAKSSPGTELRAVP